MRNSKNKSKASLIKLPPWFLWLVIGGGLLGFLDAAYLTFIRFQGGLVPCSLTGGCEKVLTSTFAAFGAVPISLIGVFYYIILFLLALLYRDVKNEFIARGLLALIVSGFVVSGILFYIQANILHSFCTYCLFSGLISTVLCGAGLIVAEQGAK